MLRLSGLLLAALVAALLFGVHPLHVESVAWVSERKDVLSTLFFLGALLFYLRYQELRRSGFFALSFVAFVLSLLAKPMGVTLPLIMFLYDYLSARGWTTRTVQEKVPFLMVSILFGVIAVLNRQSPEGSYALYISSLGDNLLIASSGLIFYLGKILMPLQPSAFYPYPAEISLHLPTFFLPLMLLLVLVSGIWITRRYTRKVIFGSLFFFLTLLPVMSIVPFHGAAAADRFMYIPSIGLFYLAGVAFQKIYVWRVRWEKAKKVSLAVLLRVIVTTLGTLTWQRSNVWQDSETLWLSVLKNYPEVPVAHNNLGNVYLKKGRLDAAISEYKMAISLNPSDAGLYNNLGAAYLKKGRLDAAIAEYQKAISLNPADALAHYNLGVAYGGKGKLDAAIAEYRKTISLNPTNAPAHSNLGIIYARKGELDAAIAEYKKAISLNPADAVAHYNLGIIHEGTGKVNEAIVEYKKAVSLDPQKKLFHYKLASALYHDGQLKLAISVLEKVLSLFPEDRTATVMLQEYQKAASPAGTK